MARSQDVYRGVSIRYMLLELMMACGDFQFINLYDELHLTSGKTAHWPKHSEKL